MKRTIYILLFAAALMAACAPEEFVPGGDSFALDEADRTAFTEKSLPVTRDGAAAGEIKVRFYEDKPSIPYVSAADFQALMLPGSSMSVTWIGDGKYQLENQYASAQVNTRDEIFSAKDYMRFTNLMDQVQAGMDNAYLDGMPFVHFAYQLSSAPQPVEFDYGAYGIDLRGDGKAVYFPFATITDLYADLFFHYAVCNGEKVVVADRDSGTNAIDGQDADFSVDKLMTGTRTEEMAAFSYGEICFVIDHFYGYPGRSPYESSLKNNGLDKTLEASAEGKTIKKLLLSTKLEDQAVGMDGLNIFLNDGGHSCGWGGGYLLSNSNFPYMAAYPELAARYHQEYFHGRLEKAYQMQLISQLREMFFPDGATYHKKGDTAICHFDGFGHLNYPAWRAYYAGTGPLPTLESATVEDDMVIFLDALKRADEDPEVKNLVIDLTLNTGGSLDLVMALTSILYGESITRCVNPLTGERYEWGYDVDRNLDGKFDEKDKKVHYDLNFCVLTSRIAFSCGNYFPSLCRDKGVLVAGEQSGGGSCGVGMYRSPEGFQYHISSTRSRLSDKDWTNIDGGVPPLVVIECAGEIGGEVNGEMVKIPNMSNFYNLDYLSGIIHEYYNPTTKSVNTSRSSSERKSTVIGI